MRFRDVEKGGARMRKVVVQWKGQSQRIVGKSHPGCCKKDGGCSKKHG